MDMAGADLDHEEHVEAAQGHRYLGFIFAAAATRHEVKQALTAARDQLRVTIQ
jgi:hypothetical protein